MSIAVVGSGYVGLSLAVLIAQKHDVKILDIDKKRIDLVNQKISPIKDREIEEYLRNKKLNLVATLSKKEAYKNAEFIIIATPTNYDAATGSFDTSSVEQAIRDIREINQKSAIVIKSTIPLGFTDNMRSMFNYENIFFSPEFLRESKALLDNLYPSRIVVGSKSQNAKIFSQILVNCSKKNIKDLPIFHMESKEAEAVKLFSNTHLAMRVSFFNELDSFCEIQDLSTEKVIAGVCSDPRIGNHYNNPSFGYGGYCLPKDTKQLLDTYNQIPNKIIQAIVESNKTRKDFVVNSILNKSPKTVGVYRLTMKQDSDNFRESAVMDVLNALKDKQIKVIIYEPFIKESELDGITIFQDINKFIESSDLIIANRTSKDLEHVKNKVYSRDIFQEN
tara:strand:- start:159 stop:1331 length:1173 start_codon:yes stop_codon:yes gene_type:complete